VLIKFWIPPSTFAEAASSSRPAYVSFCFFHIIFGVAKSLGIPLWAFLTLEPGKLPTRWTGAALDPDMAGFQLEIREV
jgi:hypothetical protein